LPALLNYSEGLGIFEKKLSVLIVVHGGVLSKKCLVVPTVTVALNLCATCLFVVSSVPLTTVSLSHKAAVGRTRALVLTALSAEPRSRQLTTGMA
jgi:hypothetical protein